MSVHAHTMQPGDDNLLSIGVGIHNDHFWTVSQALRIPTEKALSANSNGHTTIRTLQLNCCWGFFD